MTPPIPNSPVQSNPECGLRREHASSHQRARRTRVLLGIVVGLYLLGVGGLVGTLVERIRFNYRRAAVLARYEALLKARQEALMSMEREVAQGFRPKGIDALLSSARCGPGFPD
jgi:hypothetical protein